MKATLPVVCCKTARPCRTVMRGGTRRRRNFVTSCLLALATTCLGTAALAAPASRLALWITSPVGLTNASECDLTRLAPGAPFALPATPPSLTEDDISDWDPASGRWTLDQTRFPADEMASGLRDHCFVLALDGKPLSSGVILASHSARLIKFPTLSIERHGGTLQLRLLSQHAAPPMAQLLHVEILAEVLDRAANLEWQLRRMKAQANPLMVNYNQRSAEWVAAVRQRIGNKAIRPGMPVTNLITHLGPPSRISPQEDTPGIARYSWYFNTPMHVNPIFVVRVENGIVVSYKLSSR